MTEEELVASLLKPILETITQAGSRAYLSPIAIDNALCFLSSFLEDLRSEEKLLGVPPNRVAMETLRRYMEPALGEVLKYLLGQVHSGGQVSASNKGRCNLVHTQLCFVRMQFCVQRCSFTSLCPAHM